MTDTNQDKQNKIKLAISGIRKEVLSLGKKYSKFIKF